MDLLIGVPLLLLHIRSSPFTELPRSCWLASTKDSSLAYSVSSTNMAAMAICHLNLQGMIESITVVLALVNTTSMITLYKTHFG